MGKVSVKKSTAGAVFDIVFARRGKITDKVRCDCVTISDPR